MSDALTELLGRLETAAPKPIKVAVPGVGDMYVMPLTVRDMDEAAAKSMKAATQPETIARQVARILCDEAGNRFACVDETGAEPPEYTALVQSLMRMHWTKYQTLLQAAAGATDAGNV
jgi:hypothetical protein